MNVATHPPCPACGAEYKYCEPETEHRTGYVRYVCGSDVLSDRTFHQSICCKARQRYQRIAVLEAELAEWKAKWHKASGEAYHEQDRAYMAQKRCDKLVAESARRMALCQSLDRRNASLKVRIAVLEAERNEANGEIALLLLQLDLAEKEQERFESVLDNIRELRRHSELHRKGQKARIAVLEAALRQYADHERWNSVRSNSQALCWWLGVNDADNRDGWAVAEEAFKPGGKAVETKQEQPKPVEPPPLDPTDWQAIAQKLSVDLDRALRKLADVNSALSRIAAAAGLPETATAKNILSHLRAIRNWLDCSDGTPFGEALHNIERLMSPAAPVAEKGT